MRKTLLVVCATFALSTAASAAVVIVDPTGFGDATTIQGGINLSSEGDTVLVAATTYSGDGNYDLSFGSRNIHLISLGGCGNTAIDCQSLGRGMLFDGRQDTTCIIEGVTVRNALADSGAAVLCRNGSSPKFIACRFAENTATKWGGGIFCMRSSPVLMNCEFVSNEATGEGGRSYGYGAGAGCFSQSNPRLEGCLFEDNVAVGVGGGFYMSMTCNPLFIGCTFSGNHGDGNGGGAVFGGPSSHGTFTSCDFVGNHGFSGGAFYTQSCDLTLLDCTLGENTAQSFGGAFRCIYPSTQSIAGCVLRGNSSEGLAGAGSFLQASVFVSECTLVGNSALAGAAALHLTDNSPTIENSIIAFSEGATLVDCVGTAAPTFDDCVLFGNDTDDLCGTVGDTLVRDPLFCGIPEGDLTLCSNSPCLGPMNVWGEQVGALDAGCGPCDSPTESLSWGAVKALYR